MLSSIRRTSLITAALILLSGGHVWAASASRSSGLQERLAALERSVGGRLGVAVLRTRDARLSGHRADERFPFCSTFKVILVGAVLKRSETEPGLLGRRIVYTARDLVTYSPITEQHVGEGMTVAQLCAAALQHSDNTAANLLISLVGSPAAVTAFARSIGDSRFRLDRWETALNTAIPGDPRDTTTPGAMAQSLARLVLGDVLTTLGRLRLAGWMHGNTTGAARIRAGVPAGWDVGDKTGTGDYGTTNDIAVLWRPKKPPAVLAIYYTQRDPDAPARSEVIAEATRIVVDALEDTSGPAAGRP